LPASLPERSIRQVQVISYESAIFSSAGFGCASRKIFRRIFAGLRLEKDFTGRTVPSFRALALKKTGSPCLLLKIKPYFYGVIQTKLFFKQVKQTKSICNGTKSQDKPRPTGRLRPLQKGSDSADFHYFTHIIATLFNI
jgi:hypothetical protein